MSIQTIYSLYRNGQLQVNRSYQRKLVWTASEKMKLIDSIYRKYPVPLILLASISHDEGAGYFILDGLQRLHTLMSFIEQGFVDESGCVFDVNEFAAAKDSLSKELFCEQDEKIERISREVVSGFLGYNLPISIIRGADTEIITDVFGRINSYGHQLSKQERRQAGVISEFSSLVRTLACQVRGDASADELFLYDMPEISVDLPKAKQGYGVSGKEVFWVRQGIIGGTSLRDSADEQLVADILCSILNEAPVRRSSDYLDEVYSKGAKTNIEIASKLNKYGANRLAAEFKYIIDGMEKISENAGKSISDIVYGSDGNNPFSGVFSAVFLAIHGLIFTDKKKIADYSGVVKGLTGIKSNLDTTQKSMTPDGRQSNVDIIKGKILKGFVSGDVGADVYDSPTSVDIRNLIVRSKIETARIDFKIGITNLGEKAKISTGVLQKIMQTICGIANIRNDDGGYILLGVADNEGDSEKYSEKYGSVVRVVHQRFVVGVQHEAKALNLDSEKYYHAIRDNVVMSGLRQGLKLSVAENLELVEIEGQDVLVIRIPPQTDMSFLDDKCYVRRGDQTVEASPQEIASIAQKFAK